MRPNGKSRIDTKAIAELYTHTAYVPCSYLPLLYPMQAALARELSSGVFIDIGTNSLQLVRSGNVHLPKRFIGRKICSLTHELRHHHMVAKEWSWGDLSSSHHNNTSN